MEKYKKFITSAPTWNEKFELPNGSYSVSDIQDYFEHIIKTHQTVTDKHPIKIYVNKWNIRVHLKLQEGFIFNFNS